MDVRVDVTGQDEFAFAIDQPRLRGRNSLGIGFGDTAVLDQDSRGLNTRIRGIDDRATYERDLFPVCGGGEE